jgi:pyrroloquinoline quinone biosynthesis protein B
LLVLALVSCAARAPATTTDSSSPYILTLGTAQDGGIPHASCSCTNCDAARRDPSRRRLVSSLAIVVPSTGKRFLIDATPDLREQLDRLPLDGHPRGGTDRAPVDGVLLTHAHMGHYLGLAFFGFEAVHTSKLPVFCTPRMAAFLRANVPWSRLVSRDEIAIREIAPGVELELDAGVRVTPFLVPHRDEDSDTVGYIVRGPSRTVLYVPDTDRWETWSPSLRERLAGCDAALLDGTFYSGTELPGRDLTKVAHPFITTTMTLLGESVRSGGLQIAFIHLNHSNPVLDPRGEARRSIEAAGFSVASDGERIPL